MEMALQKRALRTLCAAGAALGLMTIYGCGSSGGDSDVLPAGKATLIFTAMSTARLDAPLSGINLTLALPQGISVATTAGQSGQIDTASITPGLTMSGTNLAFGSYSASSGKARLSMATTSSGYRSGEFLRLTCTVAPNTAITLSGLKAMNSPLLVTKAVGYDQGSKSTVIMTNKLKVTLDAVR
jgi:hypothetical protein